MITLDRELPPRDLRAVGAGRSWITSALRTVTAPDVLDDVELAVSELLTNAVVVAHTVVRLVVEVAGDEARISVFDDGPGDPRVLAASPDRPSGRGLAIVATVATDWGVRAEGGGKWVWASFPAHVSQRHAHFGALV